MNVRIASFGIRGQVGDSLSLRSAMDIMAAFATFAGGGRVLLGRDTRYSSPMYHAAARAVLSGAGCEVLDFGVCPTPILQFGVPQYEAAGAVSITGGHAAAGWNAVTLIGADGAYLDALGGGAVLDIYHAGDFLRRQWDGIGTCSPVDDYQDAYFDAIEKQVHAEDIRRARFKVLVDPVGGAGCRFLEPFAQRFGVRLVTINAQPSGFLARDPEPRPRNAGQMASIIRELNGDIGFLFSSDMERMSLVTDTGEPASEECTFAVITNHILQGAPGPVVTNCCTTRTIDDLAAHYEVPVFKTKVGQTHVMTALMDEQGVIGGEGSGGVALPTFSRAFDGFLMMALVLDAMVVHRRPLSGLLESLPRYHIVKMKQDCTSSNGYHALDRLLDHAGTLPNERLDCTDGIRMDWPTGWVHARISRTEQAVRVISEATRRAEAVERAEDIMRVIRQAL